jgi:hypothetical protein
VKDRADLVKLGVTFDEIPPAMKAEMRKAVEPLYLTYTAKDATIPVFIAAAERLRPKAGQ